MKTHKNVYWNMAIHSFLLYSIFAIVNPHISILFELKGYSPLYIGIFMSGFFLSGLIGPLISTAILQKYSRYRLLFCLFPIMGMVLMGLIGFIDMFWALYILIFFFGGIFSSLIPISDSMLVSLLNNPYREYGGIRAIGTLGFIAMSVIVARYALVDIHNAFSIWISIVGVLGVLLVASFFLLPRFGSYTIIPANSQWKIKKVFKTIPSAYWILLIGIFFNFLGLATLMVFLSLYLKEVYLVNNVTIVWLIAATAEILGLVWGHRIVTYLGYRYSLLLVLIGTAARLFIVALSHSLVFIYVSQILHVLSLAIALSIMIHFINHHIDIEAKPIMLGIQQSIVAMARVSAALLGGALLNAFGYFTLFYVMGILICMGALIVVIFFKKL